MLTRDQELLQLVKSCNSYPANYETWGVLEVCFSEGLRFETLADAIYLSDLFPEDAHRWDAMQLRAYCHIEMLKLDPGSDWNWYNLAVFFAKAYLPDTLGWKQLFPVQAKSWYLAQLMAY